MGPSALSLAVPVWQLRSMSAQIAKPILETLDREIIESYDRFWTLPDGRLCGLKRLLYHWTVHIDIDNWGYADRYCFADPGLAIEAMEKWDGTGDPINWHRHPTSGRRRPDGDPEKEYYEP